MRIRLARASRPRLGLATRPRLEALEVRQVLSWSGTPPTAIIPPSGAIAVTLNAQGDATGNAAISSNEVDYYTFLAPAAGSYRFDASTPSSSVDTVLGIFNGSGGRVAFNDDISSSNRDSRVTVTLAAGARYYFGITNYTGTANGSYTWAVDGPAGTTTPADDSFENNDTPATATPLGTLTASRTVSGLVMADAADWFSFTTASAGVAGNSVSIAFQNAQGDLDLQLTNASGQVLGSSTSTGNGESVSLGGLGAGTYYVRAYGYNGAINPTYTLTVSPPPVSGPPPGSGSFDVVVRPSGLSASQNAIFEQAAVRWEQVITGDLPDATYNGATVDDILIDASGVAIDGRGGVLGQAGPDRVRSGSTLPFHGTMQFDTADLAALEADGSLYAVILHEMGHVLGIGTIWESLALLSGAGGPSPSFVGAQATAAYNSIFSTNATGVPVEGNAAGPGTADGHWRESILGNELMTGYLSGAANPLSRITVGSLADVGYTVNFAAADAYSRPGGSSLRSASGSTGGGRRASLLFADGSSLVTTADAIPSGLLAPPTDPILSPPLRPAPSTRSASAWLRGPGVAPARLSV